MNTKHNVNYFKKSDGLKTIGTGMMVVGILGLWLGWSYSYYLYFISTIALPVGLVLFMFGSVGRASEEDMDSCIKSIGDGLDSLLENDKKLSKKRLAHISPMMAEGYEYSDGLMYTKAKSGTVRSSEYTKAILYILSDSLCIVRRTASLIADNARTETVEIPYDMLAQAEIRTADKTVSFGKRQFHVKETRLFVTYGDALVFSTPIHNDITADQFVDKIRKTAQSYLKEKCGGQG
ncbi:MAG: hypothetical protein IJF49_07790 [Clostridia bacterium]|nr:hypothetical protein [Clostridia bacterium]